MLQYQNMTKLTIQLHYLLNSEPLKRFLVGSETGGGCALSPLRTALNALAREIRLKKKWRMHKQQGRKKNYHYEKNVVILLKDGCNWEWTPCAYGGK